ncbi:ABC transporter permease [Paenibacillus aquistagni]|uniref:ABC transporter permease n=1 Tax=Paenibacillus aquistagni TaxID=1852522 RepID=UPI00145A1BA4|nr:ABC transporter permease [Paenibacillus aquistagni]NMM54126.1 ABC transporter permease [Paenibacillus aquistagni]
METSYRDKLLQFAFRYGAIIVILGVFAFFAIKLEYFFSGSNIADILRSISIVTFIAIGVTFSLIVDGFDLSVGSTVSLTTVVTASLMVWYEMPLFIVIIVPLLIGACVGLINSFFIVRFKIPDLLATLAVMYIVAGIHKTYTKGYSIYNNMQMTDGTKAPGVMSNAFLTIGQGEFYVGNFTVPIPVILMLLAVAAAHIFLAYTRFGRQMYMLGGNEEAARLSGIKVKRVRTWAYVLSGICAAVGGILFASRVGTGQIDAGAPLLMEAVAAVFVGFSVFGAGKPNVLGTFIGSVLIGVLVNGLTMMNLQYYTHDIIKGTVLILALAVTFYVVKKRRAA